jgi:hypothetical protein
LPRDEDEPGREDSEAAMRRRRMLDDWAWSQTIAPQPLVTVL